MIQDTQKWRDFVNANNLAVVNTSKKKTRKPQLAVKEKKTTSPIGHPEDDLTMACYKEFLKKYPEYRMRLWHTANENFVSEIGGKRKAMGVLSGVPDFKLDVPAVIDGVNICGLDIELKVKGNYQQLSQKEFEDYSLATGHIYRVIKSVPDFMHLCDQYLACVDPQIHEAICRLNLKWQALWEEERHKKARRQEQNERAEFAQRLGIDPSRIHGLD